MVLIDRLKTIGSYSKLSDHAFVLKSGLKNPIIDKQLKGLRSISIDTITAVCATFPEISKDWILVGEGGMLKSESKELERIKHLESQLSSN